MARVSLSRRKKKPLKPLLFKEEFSTQHCVEVLTGAAGPCTAGLKAALLEELETNQVKVDKGQEKAR